ncbi:MAG: dephospho-CoA kinase [Lachnospiraceae bacterium]|nr:dephospho-CoA kinase [Lachnospiraceae bacterium]
MKVIGITGGVGAGKSEILSFLEGEYRCVAIRADDVANGLKRKGSDCYHRLTELLGKGILAEDGEIHNKRMAERIFSDPDLLSKVNGIVHPAVRKELIEQVERARSCRLWDAVFIEAALLIEAGYTDFLDELWYIEADTDLRTLRLEESRGYSREKTRDIMARQLSAEEFRLHCDRVIDNSGAFEDTKEQLRVQLRRLQIREG